MEPGFAGESVDVERANAARMYDYFLGGSHNFAVDRELGDRVAAAYPNARSWARANRRFLMRVVEHCVAQGVRQFLDLGSGIPTADHVHLTARALAPEARVAYVDVEPVAVAHSQELLADIDGVSVTHADVRDPRSVLEAPTVTEVLDLTQPVAVLAVAVLHFFPESSDPDAILAGYRAALTPGSYLAISHGSSDYDDPDLAAQFREGATLYRDSATPVHHRTRARLRELLAGTELVEPGLVDVAHWHADPDAAPLGSYVALAPVP